MLMMQLVPHAHRRPHRCLPFRHYCPPFSHASGLTLELESVEAIDASVDLCKSGVGALCFYFESLAPCLVVVLVLLRQLDHGHIFLKPTHHWQLEERFCKKL